MAILANFRALPGIFDISDHARKKSACILAVLGGQSRLKARNSALGENRQHPKTDIRPQHKAKN